MDWEILAFKVLHLYYTFKVQWTLQCSEVLLHDCRDMIMDIKDFQICSQKLMIKVTDNKHVLTQYHKHWTIAK
jgi:hypothetical protein